MRTEECENGIIKAFSLEFDEPSGRQGRDFILRLEVENSGGGRCSIRMNPRKLPQLLEILKVDKIHDLIDTPIIMEKAYLGGPKPKWIQHFLASYTDKPFPVNEFQYYGSDLYCEYPDKEDIIDFLPKPLEKPPLGDTPDFSNDIDYKMTPLFWNSTFKESPPVGFIDEYMKNVDMDKDTYDKLIKIRDEKCKTPYWKNFGKK